jgi:hypothetical protein
MKLVSTSCAERNNLHVRMHTRRTTRLTTALFKLASRYFPALLCHNGFVYVAAACPGQTGPDRGRAVMVE